MPPFAHYKDLKWHYESYHKDKRLACSYCPLEGCYKHKREQFRTPDDLADHLIEAHPHLVVEIKRREAYGESLHPLRGKEIECRYVEILRVIKEREDRRLKSAEGNLLGLPVTVAIPNMETAWTPQYVYSY